MNEVISWISTLLDDKHQKKKEKESNKQINQIASHRIFLFLEQKPITKDHDSPKIHPAL